MPKTTNITFLALIILSLFLTNLQGQPRDVPSNLQLPMEEILKPSNWIARGGTWDFSKKIIFARGYYGCNKAYYAKKGYSNFTFEVRLMKLAEDGTIGIVLRYDEAKDEGYNFAVWPHGGYLFVRIKSNDDHRLKDGTTTHYNVGMNTWNTLKVVCNGVKIDLYINGYFIASVTDNTYSTGKVGLSLSGDPRQMTKFEVLSLYEQ